MAKRTVGLTTAGAVLFLAVASTAFAQSRQAQNEPVLGFRATNDAMVFRVTTGGCTSADNFNITVERASGEAQVTLTRTVPDHCKGDFPDGVEIAFSYEATGVARAEPVRLMNRMP